MAFTYIPRALGSTLVIPTPRPLPLAYVCRAFGSTLISSYTPPVVATQATFRDGVTTATCRDGVVNALRRT